MSSPARLPLAEMPLSPLAALFESSVQATESSEQTQPRQSGRLQVEQGAVETSVGESKVGALTHVSNRVAQSNTLSLEARKAKPLPGRPRSYTDPGSPALDIDMAPILGIAELPGCLPHGMTDEEAKGYAHSSKIVVAEPDKKIEQAKKLEVFKGNLMQQWHKKNKSEANLVDLTAHKPLALPPKTRKDSKTSIERVDTSVTKTLPPPPQSDSQPSDFVPATETPDTVVSPLSLLASTSTNHSQNSLTTQNTSQSTHQQQKTKSNAHASVHYDLHHHVQMMEVILAEVERLKTQAKDKEKSHDQQIADLTLKLEAAEARAKAADAIRIENDYLEHTLREKQSAIETALSRVSRLQSEDRTAKQQRQKLQNHAANLERRLEESITQRIDLEEALYGEKLSQKKETVATSQLKAMQMRIEELERKEQEAARERENFAKLQAEFELLNNDTNEMGKAMMDMKADRDRISALLQAEIRRQAMVTTRDAVEALKTNLNIDQAIAEIHDRVHKALSPNMAWQPAEEPSQRIEQLEQEIEYHVKDIILYKLDVKGYRKDIRRLHSEIRHLREFRGFTASPAPSNAHLDPIHGLGLGQTPVPGTGLISPSITPTPSISSEEAHGTPSVTQTPPHRPPTPLSSSHKKLPRPPRPTTPARNPKALPLTPPMIDGKGGWKSPPRNAYAVYKDNYRSITPQPLRTKKSLSPRRQATASPAPITRSAGTPRSLSESIISSYYTHSPEQVYTDGSSPGKNLLQQMAERELITEVSQEHTSQGVMF